MKSRDYGQQPNPPASEAHPGQGAFLFTVLSIIVSLCLIWWGAMLTLADEPSRWTTVFGCASIVYGGLALVILSWTYLAPGRNCITAIQAIAVGYLATYALALVAGLKTDFGVGGILVVALALWCHWFTVNKVVRKHVVTR